MLHEAVRIIGIIVVSTLAVAIVRVSLNMLSSGAARVSEVREESGGIVPKLKGELVGGHRRPSGARAHGLHMSISASGQLRYRQKSVIARDVA